MRILFVADGRSPIALNWIRYFIAAGHEVHLASSFPCQPEPGLASFAVVPVAMSEVKETSSASGTGGRDRLLRRFLPVGVRTRIRQWLGPLTLPRSAQRLGEMIQSIQPELVHAMRIPYEGMLAALAIKDTDLPLLISVWGNDFTLHASSTPLMRRYTRLALGRATALHTDCQRDQHLAQAWGFDLAKPGIVLPGAGGIQMDVFHPDLESADEKTPLVLNPRGLRAYVRTDTIFRAIKLVHAQRPQVRFACTGMAGQSEALRWVNELGLDGAVELLSPLSREGMAELFRQAQVMLSITTHDGTPNTLLEGLASGCFPIAGDIASIREWVTPGVNGLLVDPGVPTALAEAIMQALDQPELRARAREINLRLVRDRAEYGGVMRMAEGFYQSLVKDPPQRRKER
ncbi:MAG TPA: glycosyltransferase family 4 protein [Anaerolineales bacterium]|nr:glycosyltransferase family 4 protein [Anaerolineales bacterium]